MLSVFWRRQEPDEGTGVLHRQEVADPTPVDLRRQVFPVALSCLLVALALLLVWQRLRVVQLGYVLSTASKLERRLEQENRELRVELATLTAPERVETMARERLGLRDPGSKQVVLLP